MTENNSFNLIYEDLRNNNNCCRKDINNDYYIKDIIESKVKSDSILKHMKSGFYDKKHCDDFLKYIYFLETHRKTIPVEIDNIFNMIVRKL